MNVINQSCIENFRRVIEKSAEYSETMERVEMNRIF